MNLNKSTKEKMKEYFMRKLGAFEYKRGWLKCECPYCAGESRQPKFGIHIAQDRTNCFKCGRTPRPLTLIAELERTDVSGALKKLKDLRGVKFEEVVLKEFIKAPKMNLPDEYKLIDFGDNIVGRLARKYLKKRGFDISELSLRGVGYCDSGPKKGHIIIPFYQSGRVVYYNARNFMDDGPRYNNPSAEQDEVGKSHFIYNIDNIPLYEEINVLEGAINCLTLGDDSIAGGGKSFSDYQKNLLIKSDVEKFNIIFDYDAYKLALELGMFLTKNGKRVSIPVIPNNQDPNDIGEEATREIINSAGELSYHRMLAYYKKRYK